MRKEQASHLSNLIALAYADGRLDINEQNLIIQIGSKMGLSEEDIIFKINNPQSQEFVFPEKETERYHQLYELLSLIMIDGYIHEKEVELLHHYAAKLKFESEIVNPLIDKIREYLSKGYDNNKIQTNLSDLINKM